MRAVNALYERKLSRFIQLDDILSFYPSQTDDYGEGFLSTF